MTRNASPTPILQQILVALLALAAPAVGLAEEASKEAAPAPAAEPTTVLTSYGEINLNRPTSKPSEAQADLRRFVIGLLHRFSEKAKFVSEVEVEHAVSSKDDNGEIEIEQAFIEYQFTSMWSGRAGLILMPIGLLNEYHEPTAYYGVERNFVETAIIPSTWREGGVEAVGTFENGLTLQAGVSTSFDLNKWDAASGEGRESPLGSVHQELQLARAHDFAGFTALNWRGIPGVQLGGAAFVGRASQGQPGTPRALVALWDVHARWTPWRLDLSALFTRGTISNTAALNAPLVGNPTLIPQSFDGWYVQAALRAWSRGDQSAVPFVRYERFNTARSFADLGPGLTPESASTEGVFTAGLNFYVTPAVVVKADYQRFRVADAADRVDLGLGWSF